MNTKQIGLISELAVATALCRRGYTVLQPLGENSRYDLVFEDDRGFHSVQCKTGRLRDGVVVFSAVSIRLNTREVIRRRYDDIDYFGVYCADSSRVYLVPLSAASPSSCHLRVDPTKNGQTKRVRLAAQFEI